MAYSESTQNLTNGKVRQYSSFIFPENWRFCKVGKPSAVKQNRQAAKAPFEKNWPTNGLTPDQAVAALNRGDCTGIGLLSGTISGGLVLIDHDGPSCDRLIESTTGKPVSKALPRTVGFTSGRNGRYQLIYQIPEMFWGDISTKKLLTGDTGDDGKPEQLELRWNGSQSVILGAHPDTDGYTWLDDLSPEVVTVAEAPLWIIELMLSDTSVTGDSATTSDTRNSFLPKDRPLSPSVTAKKYSDTEWAKSYLESVPNRDLDWYTWRDVLFALHKAGVPESDAKEWSRQSSKHTDRGFSDVWRHIDDKGRTIGLGTLALMAKKNGWVSPFQKRVSPLSPSVTAVSPTTGDTQDLDVPMDWDSTVTGVTEILQNGYEDWEETARLSDLQSVSSLPVEAFWKLVGSLKTKKDEVTLGDIHRLDEVIRFRSTEIDWHHVLPSLSDAIIHDANALNIDPVMIWQYLLPSVLTCLGKKTELDCVTHSVPAIAWTCIVAETGKGKTRAEKLVVAPLKELQLQEAENFKERYTAYKAALKASQKAKDGNTEEPEMPTEKKLLFSVATPQAVLKRLGDQEENGSLWFRDELGGLFKSLDQFTKGRESEALELLLEAWDGSSIMVDRVSYDDSFYVRDPRLNMAGGTQPAIYRRIFKDPDDSQGMAARFLFATPKAMPNKRTRAYCMLKNILPSLYSELLKMPLESIRFTQESDDLFDVLYEQIGDDSDRHHISAVKGWLRKLPGQICRIAIALHALECVADPQKVREYLDVETLKRAISLGNYYRACFERVQEQTIDSDDVSSILTKIWDLGLTSNGVTPRDVYRSIKAIARRAKEVRRDTTAYVLDLFSRLVEAGRGRIERMGRVVKFFSELGDSGDTGKNKKNTSDVVTLVTLAAERQRQQVSRVSPSGVTLGDTNGDTSAESTKHQGFQVSVTKAVTLGDSAVTDGDTHDGYQQSDSSRHPVSESIQQSGELRQGESGDTAGLHQVCDGEQGTVRTQERPLSVGDSVEWVNCPEGLRQYANGKKAQIQVIAADGTARVYPFPSWIKLSELRRIR